MADNDDDITLQAPRDDDPGDVVLVDNLEEENAMEEDPAMADHDNVVALQGPADVDDLGDVVPVVPVGDIDVDDDPVDNRPDNVEEDMDPDDPDDYPDSEGEEEEEEDDIAHEEVDDYFKILKYMSKEWLKIEVDHRVSKVASEAFWALSKTWFPKLFDTKKAQGISRKTPSFIHIRRQMHKDCVPPIHMDIAYQDKDTGEVTIVEDTPITPKKQYPSPRFQKMWEIAYVKVI